MNYRCASGGMHARSHTYETGTVLDADNSIPAVPSVRKGTNGNRRRRDMKN